MFSHIETLERFEDERCADSYGQSGSVRDSTPIIKTLNRLCGGGRIGYLPLRLAYRMRLAY
jgi:hypothetical protein